MFAAAARKQTSARTSRMRSIVIMAALSRWTAFRNRHRHT